MHCKQRSRMKFSVFFWVAIYVRYFFLIFFNFLFTCLFNWLNIFYCSDFYCFTLKRYVKWMLLRMLHLHLLLTFIQFLLLSMFIEIHKIFKWNEMKWRWRHRREIMSVFIILKFVQGLEKWTQEIGMNVKEEDRI